MNRVVVNDEHQRRCVPHRHGDEPEYNATLEAVLSVFPIGMGMNRIPTYPQSE